MTEKAPQKHLSAEDIEKMKSILAVDELPSQAEDLTDEQKQKLIKGGFNTLMASSYAGFG